MTDTGNDTGNAGDAPSTWRLSVSRLRARWRELADEMGGEGVREAYEDLEAVLLQSPTSLSTADLNWLDTEVRELIAQARERNPRFREVGATGLQDRIYRLEEVKRAIAMDRTVRQLRYANAMEALQEALLAGVVDESVSADLGTFFCSRRSQLERSRPVN